MPSGCGLAFTICQTVAVEFAPAGQEGEATAGVQLANLLGAAVGTSVTAIVIAHLESRLPLAIGLSFLTTVAAAIAAGLLAPRLPGRRPGEPTHSFRPPSPAAPSEGAPPRPRTPPSPVRTIDLDRWRQGTPDEKAAVAAEFDVSMRDAGFVVIVGQACPTDCGLRSAPGRWRSSTSPRRRSAIGPALATAGWVPFGMEANSYASGEPTPPDLKETWVPPPPTCPGTTRHCPTGGPTRCPT